MSRSVLDASALLALLREEPGAAAVAEAIVDGALISAVNWAETLSKLADAGYLPDEAEALIAASGITIEQLAIVDFDREMARRAAALRKGTREGGLSLGDRACLALASARSLPVLTTDRAWIGLIRGLDIRLVR